MSLPKEKYHMSDPLLLHYLRLQRLLPAIRTRTTKQAIILIISTTQAIILIITTITTIILIINTLVVHISCVTITLEVCFCNSSNILFYHCMCCLFVIPEMSLSDAATERAGHPHRNLHDDEIR
jgi:hypothetical protein